MAYTDYGFLSDEQECYKEVVTLQQLRGWVWSIRLAEEVCVAWEEWSVPPGRIQTLDGGATTVTDTELVYRSVAINHTIILSYVHGGMYLQLCARLLQLDYLYSYINHFSLIILSCYVVASFTGRFFSSVIFGLGMRLAIM